MLDDDDITTGDDDLENIDATADKPDETSSDHTIPAVSEINESKTDEDQFEEPVASPEVTGESDVMSGDAPDGEPADIDAEMAKVGLETNSNDED